MYAQGPSSKNPLSGRNFLWVRWENGQCSTKSTVNSSPPRPVGGNRNHRDGTAPLVHRNCRMHCLQGCALNESHGHGSTGSLGENMANPPLTLNFSKGAYR